MTALTMGLAEAKNKFSRLTAEVNRTGRPVNVLKHTKPWVIIQPARTEVSAVGSEVDF